MKRTISFILCAVMIISLLPCGALAASSTLSFEKELAADLKALGLFKGVSDTDFALERSPTRVEALVMLIRVLGKEAEALSDGGEHPFVDVPAWADKYVGYAYENELTNGISETSFGSEDAASAAMYVTFVLRALGYSDKDGDFAWDNPYTLARENGLMKGNPNLVKFLRADVVLISYAALEAKLKESGKSLAEKLIEAKVFSGEEYQTYYNFSAFDNTATKLYTSEEIYKNFSPAVFYIEVYDKNERAIGSGSGFFIDSDGTAVTNYHVIDGAHSAKIKLSESGKICNVLGVYEFSEKEDWAVIKIEGGGEYPFLEQEKSANVTGGQTVYAIGSPLGLENTISEGIVSNANRVLDGNRYIQISSPISPGSSGGALINGSGKVIGITSEAFIDGQNLNLARPISVIDGYKKGPITFLSSIRAGASGGGVSEEKAKELLRDWIEKNGNIKTDVGTAYCEMAEVEAGVAACAVTYDKALDCFLVTCNIKFTEGDMSISSLGFAINDDEVAVVYSYQDEEGSEPRVTEDGIISKKGFCEGMKIVLEQEGLDPEEHEWHEETAAFLLYICTVFVDEVMRENLSQYGVSGIRDFGFSNFS